MEPKSHSGPGPRQAGLKKIFPPRPRSSLSTIVEMVSTGLGITLLPEICIGVEGRGWDISIVRFVDPEPARTIGLAWRRSSPRADDFRALGKVVQAAGQALLKRRAPLSSGARS